MSSTELDAEVRRALEAWGSHDQDAPYAVYAELLRRGPVHEITLSDGHRAHLVIGYDQARTLLNDRRLSKDMTTALSSGSDVVDEGLPGPDFARHMLNVDPPDHTRLRRLVSVAFSAKRVEQLRPHVQAIVDDLLDEIAAAGPDATVDLVSQFAFPMPFTVICELLGVPDGDRDSFGDALGRLLSPAPTPEDYARVKSGSDDVVAHINGLIEAKAQEPADDLVSALIEARDGDERLDQRELRSTILQLVVAGHDTTASLIGNSVVALLTHPEQLTWLRSADGHAAGRIDSDRLTRAIEELLRFDPPAPGSTFRYALEDVQIGDHTIPAGAQVFIALAAPNHDPRRFASPDSLDLERDDTRHLSFGHGIHFCLGAGLARMEGHIALRTLFDRFPSLSLAVEPGDLHWGHGDGAVLRGLSELPVVPGPEA